MKNILPLLRKRFHLSFLQRIEAVIAEFSITEKVIFTVFAVVLIVSGLNLLQTLNRTFQVEVPSHGGSFTEGMIGAPHFTNPLFVTSDIDREVSTLIYSGLMRINKNGDLTPDIAESYEISADGKKYTFTIRDDAFFHNGDPVTADDVEFTIQKALDPLMKSPRRANWEGVAVEKLGDKQIAFTLKQPYAPFLETTTLGILPKTLWKDVPVEQFTLHQLNTEPVGAGPYKVLSLERAKDSSLSGMNLLAFKNYTLDEPYITNLRLVFFQNEESAINALKNRTVQSVSNVKASSAISLKSEKGLEIHSSPLPRIFGVFFNQNQAPLFLNKEVREALDLVTDRNAIIDEVFGGYASTIQGPLPLHPSLIAVKPRSASSTEERLKQAKTLLEKSGWKINSDGVYEKTTAKKDVYRLAFSISTSNTTDLMRTAEILKNQWEKLGAKVDVNIFDIGDLNQVVIRPRKYEALLFGEIIGRDMDPYAFWHSSQRNDPGLNIAMYTNAKVDSLIENARTSTSTKQRISYLDSLQTEITKETPAIFLYSPHFIYLINKEIKHELPTLLFQPSDRFSTIHRWYVETDYVWDSKFLTNK